MNVEDHILLDKFTLRDYQKPIWDAIEKGYRKLCIILPRRAGKDITLWNLAIRQCLKKICLVHYVLPTYGQANRAIFSAITSSGETFLDYIPQRLIKSINSSEMKIVFYNGSILQCVAGDSHDVSIRGTNPFMVILSEYAYMSAEVYNTISPILAANKGIVVMASTPYGKNHFWHLYQIAKELPDWWVYRKTVEETQHIDPIELETERKRMSPELFAQEYNVSFERGVDGAIYGRLLCDLKKNGQVTTVAYEPGLLVHVAIDIGVSKGNATTAIWFQVVGEGTIIRIIDCHSIENHGLDHLVDVMQSKPYWNRMGKFFAPHDLAVREWGGGAITRYEKARQLGINFTILDQIGLEDGIENVMTHFPKFWIDGGRCKSLVDALENYYREYDEERKVYRAKPVHNWASNYADSLRYMCQAIHLTKRGMSSEDFERARHNALYGNQGELPWVFKDDRLYRNLR